MNLITCPNHHGLIIENHPCPKCGSPQVLPKGREPYKHPWAETSQEQGVDVQQPTSTTDLESGVEQTATWCGKVSAECQDGGACLDPDREGYLCVDDCQCFGDKEWFEARGLTGEAQPECIIEAPRRPDYGVIDRNTGEVVQLSLLGAQWDQYKVETLRLSLSGGDEFIKAMFDELVDGELSPGAIVEVIARGIVKEHAPVFKKDGHEGKTVILLEVVRRITVLGHMTGKVEAAQNVDGEAKVLEDVDPEVALQEADDLRDQEDATDGE